MAISQCPVGSQEKYRRKRNCLPEIATAPLGPRNDKSGAITILSAACTCRRCAAGRGQPGPYSARLATSFNYPLSIINFPLAACPAPTSLLQNSSSAFLGKLAGIEVVVIAALLRLNCPLQGAQ